MHMCPWHSGHLLRICIQTHDLNIINLGYFIIYAQFQVLLMVCKHTNPLNKGLATSFWIQIWWFYVFRTILITSVQEWSIRDMGTQGMVIFFYTQMCYQFSGMVCFMHFTHSILVCGGAWDNIYTGWSEMTKTHEMTHFRRGRPSWTIITR